MASNTDPKTVLLSGDPLCREAISATGSAIDPGMIIEITTDGEAQEHSTAGGNAAALFAREEDYAGGSISDTYAVGDNVPYMANRPGDQVYAFLATGNDASVGDFLESDGNGALQVSTSQAVVCKAVEALNNTSGSNSRIKVEVV